MRQNHSVAQLVEHITFNDGVAGSNPARMTKIFWLSVRLVKVKAVINISKIHIFKDSRYSGDGFSRLLFAILYIWCRSVCPLKTPALQLLSFDS